MSKTLILPFGRDKLLRYLPNRSSVAEIGVYKGKFSRKILMRTRPKRLVLVDAWDIDVKGGHIPHIDSHGKKTFSSLARSLPRKLKIYCPFTDISTHQSLSADAAVDYKDGEFDWIYVDADHSYEGVKKDLEAWAPKVCSEGFILGHDFSNQEAAVNANFGVMEAVRDFVAENEFHLVFLTTDYFPSFCIAKNLDGLIAETLRNICKKEKFLFELDSDLVFGLQHKRYARVGKKTGVKTTF